MPMSFEEAIVDRHEMSKQPEVPDILVQAGDAINARHEKYGWVGDNFGAIADYWTTHLDRRGVLAPDAKLTTVDVAILMSLVKIARLGETPGHRDSVVDGIGYLALIESLDHLE